MSQYELFRNQAILELLGTFCQVIKGLSIDYFVVGALARDIRLSAVPEYAPRRATKDVDIAVMIGSEQQFQQVKDALIATGLFTAHETQPIKLFYRHSIEVDLIPFGDIEGKGGEVHIEKPRPVVLDMPGFKEVISEAEVLTIGGLEIMVCSLEGIILLKLFANANDPSRTKDISDIEHILKAYFDIMVDTIFVEFKDVPDFYTTTDIDYLSLVSARVVGRVMGRILGKAPELRLRLHTILQAKTPNRYWPEMLAGLEEA